MDERLRLKGAKPGQVFPIRYGPNPGESERMVVVSNDGKRIVLKPLEFDRDPRNRLTITTEVLSV